MHQCFTMRGALVWRDMVMAALCATTCSTVLDVDLLDGHLLSHPHSLSTVVRTMANAHFSSRRRYSFYLPLHPERQKSVRKSSMSKHEDAKARKERAELSRLSVESSALKRRSTMNSRQAYDEEETLRRVIEESKGDTELAASVMSSRKGKRTRDDSSEE